MPRSKFECSPKLFPAVSPFNSAPAVSFTFAQRPRISNIKTRLDSQKNLLLQYFYRFLLPAPNKEENFPALNTSTCYVQWFSTNIRCFVFDENKASYNWGGMRDKLKISEWEGMTNELHCIQKPANSHICKVNNSAHVKREHLINTLLQFHTVILNELAISSIGICFWFRKSY